MEKEIEKIKASLKKGVIKKLLEKIKIDKIKERLEYEIVGLKETFQELGKNVEYLESRETKREEVRSVKENIQDNGEEFRLAV